MARKIFYPSLEPELSETEERRARGGESGRSGGHGVGRLCDRESSSAEERTDVPDSGDLQQLTAPPSPPPLPSTPWPVDRTAGKLRCGVWNVGGLRINKGSLFELAEKKFDILCLVETFLESASEAFISFPPSFLYFTSPAIRNPRFDRRTGGRGSGGILILLRADQVKANAVSVLSRGPDFLALRVTLLSGLEFCLVCVYRAADNRSPVHNPSFFPDLAVTCLRAEQLNLPVCVAGDFNAKIGSLQGQLGLVEEFVYLLPEAVERDEVCEAGIEMLSTFSNLEYFRIQFTEFGRECLTFRVRPGQNGHANEGGSIIDHVFLSPELASVVSDPGVHVGLESNHVLLTWSFDVPTAHTARDSVSPVSFSLTFDLEKLLDVSIPDSLLAVLDDPDTVNAESAYTSLLDFIRTYTKQTRTCTPGRRETGEGRELKELRRVVRKVERMRAKEQDPARREFLGREYSRLASLWREKRDVDRKRVAEELRSRFWSAHKSGNSYLAWKYARTNLSGKGGGIRTAATRAITREGWEEHFSNLLGGNDPQATARALYEISLPGVAVAQLDEPFAGWEVAEVLDRKRNHKAPGPDGIRIEFLRVFRYDDRVCQVLANVFSIIYRECWSPAEWERAYLYVLYKGVGDVSLANSFRGIALKSHLLKLFESLLCARLTRWLNERGLLPPEQLAYRSGLSGTDHIFYLHVLRESEVAKDGSFFAGFIDLRKAFPSVNRRRLLESLVHEGVSDKMVAMFRQLYTVDSFQLLLDGVPGTVVFTVVVGVHEGSCLSPTLFIFFVRDLPDRIRNAIGVDAPIVAGINRGTIIYADDVTELARSIVGLQVNTDTTVDFFREQELGINPDKSDFVHFVRPRSQPSPFTITIDGVQRDSVETVRYLGVMFDARGNWKHQKTVALGRASLAVGRLKVITTTIGRGHVKMLINLFDSIVGSVYRYGLGVWGFQAGSMTVFDTLFTSYITWLFRLPPTSCKNAILASFARRCTQCDALFLASVQLALADSTGNPLWRELVGELRSGRRTSKWHKVLLVALRSRGLEANVTTQGTNYVATRKQASLTFAQYCFHSHLNVRTGTSGDDFRTQRPFGTYPFLFAANSNESRYLFSFVLSCWRWLDKGAAKDYPRTCEFCLCANSAWHVLFDCPVFSDVRESFEPELGRTFDYDCILSSQPPLPSTVVRVGKSIYFRVLELCRRFGFRSDMTGDEHSGQ